jgi:hypothetical protein
MSVTEDVDWRLVQAQINALDFTGRTMRPWARDPSYYLTIFADQSDTAEHEGLYAMTIDLWLFDYPLSATDSQRLKTMLGTVSPLLKQARSNLAASQAGDLFLYGAKGFRDQAAALAEMSKGTLMMNTVKGQRLAKLNGDEEGLKDAIDAATQASIEFADWIEKEAPSRTGPCGIGKEEYSWMAKNVCLLPYDWDAQEVLLKRELDRAWSSLALEEFRNRHLPPAEIIEDSASHDAIMRERATRITSFLIDSGFMKDRPWYREAIPAQQLAFTPAAKRDFFRHIVAVDPLPLQAHFYHWVELARVANDPQANPLRFKAPILNVWQERCEGLATAMEEVTLQAGLYEDLPRSRELVWIMLANRAARGLAALYVQANMMSLDEASRFHAIKTPRNYSDAQSPLVAFEQLLYARQPGYGPSYVIGKIMEKEGKDLNTASIIRRITEAGFLPLSLMEDELVRGSAD